MVIDAFMARDEIDLIDLRMKELEKYVDLFVCCESDVTHSGKLKPYYIQDAIDSGKLDRNRIVSVKAQLSHWGDGLELSQVRENTQREVIGFYLAQYHSESDIVLLSDVDEIPRGSTINEGIAGLNLTKGIWQFQQTMSYLYMNTVTDGFWNGTKLFRLADQLPYIKAASREISLTPMTKLRYSPIIAGTVKNGGWHFSTLGGHPGIRKKLDTYMHVEFMHMSDHEIMRSLNELHDPFHKQRLKIIGIEALPEYVKDNLNEFERYIYKA